MSASPSADVRLTSSRGPARMPAVGWCVDGRVDPITGLVAFPDFHTEFPELLVQTVSRGACVGLAIGDVDNLKEYVEGTNRTEPGSFGHLAGYAVMSRLGEVAQGWFWDQDAGCGCVSTFGGDEIIVAMLVNDGVTFAAAIVDLRDRLNRELPRTVSFTLGLVGHAALPGPRHHGWAHEVYLGAMTTLDRHLFDGKAARRRSGQEASGFVAVVDLAATDRAGSAS